MKLHPAAVVASIGLGLLAGCDLAPVYDPPHFILPESYQGSGPFEVAHPDEAIAMGAAVPAGTTIPVKVSLSRPGT